MMSPRSTFSVTVRRGGGKDAWGDDKPPTTHTISGCVRWPRGSSETLSRSDVVTSGWMLSIPYGADLVSTDQVQLPGDPSWWSVEGDVLHSEYPFSDWRPGTPVALTRTRG